MEAAKPVGPSESVWNDTPAPDVWWGSDGIDALLWADLLPCADPIATVLVEAEQSVVGGTA